jgi:hypothetical protein
VSSALLGAETATLPDDRIRIPAGKQLVSASATERVPGVEILATNFGITQLCDPSRMPAGPIGQRRSMEPRTSQPAALDQSGPGRAEARAPAQAA